MSYSAGVSFSIVPLMPTALANRSISLSRITTRPRRLTAGSSMRIVVASSVTEIPTGFGSVLKRFANFFGPIR